MICRAIKPATTRTGKLAAALLGFVLASGFAGCVHRIDIQQGNFLKTEELDRVQVGMTRVQVRALLGTPMVADPFETERWDYLYYFKKGRIQKPVQRKFTVYFVDDKVARIERSDKPDAQQADNAAAVPTSG